MVIVVILTETAKTPGGHAGRHFDAFVIKREYECATEIKQYHA